MCRWNPGSSGLHVRMHAPNISKTEMHKFLSWMAVCVTWVDIQSTRIINIYIVGLKHHNDSRT